MQVYEVTDLRSWDDYKDDWQKLQKACNLCHPFLDWNWIRPWADYLPSEQKKPLILIVKNQHNDVVGIAPFQNNQKGLYKYLEGFAQEFADYIDWLCTPGLEEEVGEKIYDWITSAGKIYDYIRIYNLFPGGLAHKTLRKLCPDQIHKHSIAPQVEINGEFKTYIKTLNKKFISDTKRRERKLSKEVGDVEYFIIDDDKEIPVMMEIVAKWMRSRRNDKNEMSYFDRKGMTEHFIKLYQKLHNQKMLHLSALKIKNRLIAINVAFKYENVLFSYTPVFDPEFKKYSVIRLLKLKHIEECFIQGISIYDFCLGGEKYKLDFNPTIKQLYCLTLHGSNFNGFIKKLFDTYMSKIIQ